MALAEKAIVCACEDVTVHEISPVSTMATALPGELLPIDASVVRILIVPAVMRLLGRANWWAPRPLALFHRWVGAGESRPAIAQAVGGE